MSSSHHGGATPATGRDDDLNIYQWGAKHYGKTSFGVNWPTNTFWGAGLNLRIALIRLYVSVVYLPILRPLMRKMPAR